MVRCLGLVLFIIPISSFARPLTDAQITFKFTEDNTACSLTINDGDGTYKVDSDTDDFEEKAISASINYDATISVSNISHSNFAPADEKVFLDIAGTKKTISQWISEPAEDISKGNFSLMLNAEHPRDDLYGKTISTTVELSVTCK
ncbi:hypothetical protein L4D09_13165 [Photobacterium makurazakiensis]|uniref:hypothetical protein n=1 Tax=Photobacterium makurazakiensis TaxID=2910234 RepID=UPI003D0C9719